MNLKFAYDFTSERFKKKHLENFDLEARWLIAGVLNIDESTIWSDSKRKLTTDEIKALSEKVEQRLEGKPLAYIIGKKDFYGRTFKVSKDTLIPRPETELIIDLVLKVEKQSHAIEICDMGTGTGCIGLTLLAELPLAKLTAVDVSPGALEIAKENAKSLEVADRAEFLFGAVTTPQFNGKKFDIVVANPPYIAEGDPEVEDNVLKYEPYTALFAPNEGYKLIFDWILVTAEILKPGGMFVFEIGRNQADIAKKFVENFMCFKDVRIIKDLNKHDRLIAGLRQ